VEVKGSRHDSAETEKADVEIYSKVMAILNADAASQSRIHQSGIRNHAVT
jgi:hypothetical protein